MNPNQKFESPILDVIGDLLVLFQGTGFHPLRRFQTVPVGLERGGRIFEKVVDRLLGIRVRVKRGKHLIDEYEKVYDKRMATIAWDGKTGSDKGVTIR